MPPASPRVAVVHPYWTLWEHTAGPTFRADRLELARRVATALGDGLDIVGVADFASADEAVALAPGYLHAGIDALLVVQTMAAPPAYALHLIEALADVPVVVWALHETGLVEGSFDHGGITTQGATVGAPMLSNILGRHGRPFELLLGRLADEGTLARVRDALRLAAVARGIRRSRIGRVGAPLDGYLHVDVGDDELRAGTGIEVVRIRPDELVERYRAVDGARVAALDAEVRAEWAFEEDVDDGESLERSLRAAVALEDLVVDHALDAGAFNCHVPQFRFGEPMGIAPCWALGRSTSAGVPWTCTGDLLTSVAMLVTKRLGGAAVYHEIEAIDYDTGEVVIANSGEHDLAWLAPGERPRLRRNGWFCGKDPHCGVCAVLEPAPGPATLVGFTPHPDARGGFRLVAARGELTERRFPETGTVNGAFRFRDGPVEQAWARWANAGVNHHSSATPGDLSGDVATVARHLGIEAVIV
jgi:L-arabinose isomerase